MSSARSRSSNSCSSSTLAEAGIIRPSGRTGLRTALSADPLGRTPAAGYKASAARYPDEIAIIDELGTLTFREVHERTNALAHALADDGVNEGDNVAIMCRNHRGFVETMVACSKLGAHALFLNTAFTGPQLTDVAEREKPKAIIYDEEFAEVLQDAEHAPQALHRLARAGGRAQGPDARGAHRGRRPVRRRPARRARQGDHPHARHDRHAEGRLAHAAEVARPGRRAARAASRSRRARRR